MIRGMTAVGDALLDEVARARERHGAAVREGRAACDDVTLSHSSGAPARMTLPSGCDVGRSLRLVEQAPEEGCRHRRRRVGLRSVITTATRSAERSTLVLLRGHEVREQ